jgi:hypothetical protein
MGIFLRFNYKIVLVDLSFDATDIFLKKKMAQIIVSSHTSSNL